MENLTVLQTPTTRRKARLADTAVVPASIPLSHTAKFRSDTEFDRLRKMTRQFSKAVSDFSLLDDGDRVMVCISGGKDSYALLDFLLAFQRKSPLRIELLAVNIDQGWPNYDTASIELFLRSRDVPHRMVNKDFASIVAEKLPANATPCSLCSRLRRGVLYNLAESLGCNKIALGHHKDDIVETLLLNMFYAGRLAAMPPRLESDDGRNIVIRPMAYIAETDLQDWSSHNGYPVVSCGCPSCGLPHQKRQQVKGWLKSLEGGHPEIKNHILAATKSVQPSHLLDPTVQKVRPER